MRAEVLRRVLTGRRRGLIAWVASLVALMVLMVVAYPAVRDQPSFAELLEDYPDFVQQIMGLGSGLDVTSPGGYLNSQVFANMLPLLLLVFLIGFATRETAGEERDHTLDLLLAHPVTRTRVLLEKLVAMLGCGLVFGAVSALTLMIFGPLVDLDLSVNAYVGATLANVAVGWVFGTVALAVAAWTGSRAVSIGVASGLAVVLYVVWGLAALVEALEITNPINPWYWSLAGDPVINGIQGANLLLLFGMTAAFSAAAVFGFRRRDLGV